MRYVKALSLFLIVVAISCGDNEKAKRGCKGENPHQDLVPGSAVQLSPANNVCDGVASGCEAKDEDAMILLTGDGEFLLAWISNRVEQNDDIYIMHSAEGKTWGEPIRVTSHIDSDVYPTLIEYPNTRGRFHLSWMRQQITAPFARHIIFNSSPDGVTWDEAQEVEVTTGLVDDFVPYLYAHGDVFHIYFVNSFGRSLSGTRDLFVARSTNGGASWDNPLELSSVNSPTDLDTMPYVVQRPFSTQLMLVWVRGTGNVDYLDPSTDLVYSTSDDGLNWGPTFAATLGDDPDVIVDTIPALYNTGTQEIFTWMEGVNNEPHIMEVALTFPSTYPADKKDVTAENGVPGYSPRVTATLKPNTYIRSWVSADKKIYYQVFEY